MLNRIRGYSGNAWTLVLTVPPEDRERFLNSKYWKKAIREFWKLLTNDLGLSFMYERSHAQGENVADGFHPHANIMFITPAGTKRLDLDQIKDFWQTAAKLSRKPTIYAKYIRLDAQNIPQSLKHWIAYVERPFPNAFWKGNRSKWYGKAPSLTELHEGCPICGAPLQPGRITRQEIQEVEEYFSHGLLPGYDRHRDGSPGVIWRVSQDKCPSDSAPPHRGPRRVAEGQLSTTTTTKTDTKATSPGKVLADSLLFYLNSLSSR